MRMTAAEREQFILNNLGLVGSCAARLRGRGIEYEELYQTGCAGLIKAVDGFDPSRGCRFSSYAVPYILGEMKQLFRQSGSVHVSRSLRTLAAKAGAAYEQLLQQNGTEPHISDVAQLCGCSVQEVAQAMAAVQETVSLDEQLEAGWEPEDAESEDLRLSKIILKKCILGLAKQDRLLLYYRSANGSTQFETAKLLGVSQSYVSRREQSLLRALKARLSPD